MNLYAILRRDGFVDGPALSEAAERSTAVGNDMSDDIRWIRTYVLGEESGSVGTVCIYQASSEEAIRKHAAPADLPISEIIPISDTMVVRPDPECPSRVVFRQNHTTALMSQDRTSGQAATTE